VLLCVENVRLWLVWTISWVDIIVDLFIDLGPRILVFIHLDILVWDDIDL
jgi:hypothetical protein